MIVLDTSVLVGVLTGAQGSAASLRTTLERGRRVVLPALVLFEWLRGPRGSAELEAQEALFPATAALPFRAEEARVAARLSASVGRARGRDIDLAIAAHALVVQGEVWTLNESDFEDVPDLRLFSP